MNDEKEVVGEGGGVEYVDDSENLLSLNLFLELA